MKDTVYTTLIRPLVTEKGVQQSQKHNAYPFEVAAWANKQQIREAVEKIYSVKVVDVRTATRKGKPRRMRFNQWSATSHWKKAVVVLDPEYHIDLF
jgi:large subunit ribosomal protein L23